MMLKIINLFPSLLVSFVILIWPYDLDGEKYVAIQRNLRLGLSGILEGSGKCPIGIVELTKM